MSLGRWMREDELNYSNDADALIALGAPLLKFERLS